MAGDDALVPATAEEVEALRVEASEIEQLAGAGGGTTRALAAVALASQWLVSRRTKAINEAVEIVARAVDASQGVVIRRDPERAELHEVRGGWLSSKAVSRVKWFNFQRLEAASLEEALVAGRPIVTRRGVNSASFDEFLESEGHGTLYMVPLTSTGGDYWGLLVMSWPDIGYHPSSQTTAVIRTLAASISGAIAGRAAHRLQLDAERQLAEVQRQDSLDVMAAGIAHDFGNVLQVLSGQLSILERTLPMELRAADKSIAAMHHSVDRARQLVTTLRLYSGGEPIAMGPFDIAAAVATAADMARDLAASHVTIDSRSVAERCRRGSGPDGCVALGNEDLFVQVVLNLAINASEAFGEQPGRITIDMSSNGQEFVVEVADD
ncbi:MAG: hypothetical protein KC731_15820, partial [Myxococcales bacterium]|nr:hypothetical protein [Myxococcales bacterium]